MEISPKDVPTALIHLYRGELGRMTVYRTRLDTTTNWAVGSTAALSSFALGQERVPPFVFLLVLFLNWIFLMMEVRRFRFYELIRKRVRLLETGFYAAVMGKEERARWEEDLWESLKKPAPPIGFWKALSVRLKRNYLWLFLAVYLAWFFKLSLSGHFINAAAVGPIHGIAVLAFSIVLLLILIGVALSFRLEEEE